MKSRPRNTRPHQPGGRGESKLGRRRLFSDHAGWTGSTVGALYSLPNQQSPTCGGVPRWRDCLGTRNKGSPLRGYRPCARLSISMPRLGPSSCAWSNAKHIPRQGPARFLLLQVSDLLCHCGNPSPYSQRGPGLPGRSARPFQYAGRGRKPHCPHPSGSRGNSAGRKFRCIRR